MVVGIWLRSQSIESNPETEQAPAPPTLVVEDGTSYLYDEQGRSDTILSAPLTHYYRDERGTQFTQPRLEYRQDEARIFLRAERARQDQARSRLEMEGDVFGERQVGQERRSRTEFNAEHMLYRIRENQAETDVPVIIRSADSTTHAIGTIWHLNQNLFILKQNVRSYYAPDHNF